MNVSAERSKAIWGAPEINAPALTGSVSAEVAVIGSGVAGLSVAYELARTGMDVVVIDRGPIASGMSARTTAHLSAYTDDGFAELIRMRGLDAARLWRQSQADAIDRIEAIADALNANCDFRRLDGLLFLAPETDPKVIDSELVASAQVGMLAVKQQGAPFARHQSTPCLRFPNQATFHPLKYLTALAAAIRHAGGRLFANSPVVSVAEKDGSIQLVTGDGAHVTAAHAVVATNAPINDRLAVHAKQAPYRTYAAAYEIARDSLPDALYWDTLDPYHYVRLQPGDAQNDILIVGGEDHKTGECNNGDQRIRNLARWTRDMIPGVGTEITRWSGQILEPLDYVAFIGRNPGDEHIYIATGDSGQGMTHGAVAGLLIADLIQEKANPWTALYDPARKPIRAMGEFLRENATAAKNFAEYLTPGEISSADKLASGEGAILRRGMGKVALYRRMDGSLCERSAICTHLGCHIHWNSFEKCWDCPCHGSQFSPEGEPLNGPAATALAKTDS
ncbi:FAD-dependent oxidoreductase [Methylocystis echinoides]|uniref:(2Fe-2S) ferredoxin n=1 Tax=Methylocystis echinoides TaxID=29468 RepID=A0A9W6GRW0_9HYPH|nr:FAD-dependent oxidoreductase [Methylocystis echinoides]GLI91901.1 (2Fe-2S) ferredoxin [Methylocystis echinoides]